MSSIQINDREIGIGQAPYTIAELSGNHNQSLERALQIVDAAAAAGADAIKLQTYTAETMTLNIRKPGFLIDDPNSLWHGRQLYELYHEAHTPWDWHKPIMDRAREHGISCFSSPFDDTAVDFLESLNVPAYKVASFECTDLPLIKKIASTGKPMIISTGMASLAEIDDAVRTARESGCHEIVLLKCTSTYPSTPKDTNILTIPHLRSAFGCEVGLSDHTMGIGVAAASVALGAVIIEKHFTLRRSDGGVDSTFSLEPEEFEQLVIETKRAWEALGTPSYGTTDAEKGSLQFRRSVHFVKDLSANERITREHLRALRPGTGLPPRFLDDLIGRRVKQDVTIGTPTAWSLFD